MMRSILLFSWSQVVWAADAVPKDDNSMYWVIGIGLLVVALVVVVLVIEHSRNQHKTISVNLQADYEEVVKERDKLKKRLIEANAAGGKTSDLTVEVKADTSNFHNELAKAESAIVAFRDKAVACFTEVQKAAANGSGEAIGAAASAPVAGANDLSKFLSPEEARIRERIPASATGLGAVYIDRDDLMKDIGRISFAQPVVLDDAPVHNGIGDPVFYWTWPKGLRTEKPSAPGVAK